MTVPAPDTHPEPRYPTVSRRAFLRRSALLGLAGAALPAIAACGGSSSTSSGPTASGTVGGATPSNAAAVTTTTGSTASSGTPATTIGSPIATEAPTATAGAEVFPAGAQLQVSFTFQAAGGGRVESPYIAVWIEDDTGELVQTVSLWYKADESKYLNDLKRWNSKNNRTTMTTGATRRPGSFSVAWNGTNLDGIPVTDGEYYVCIEAAREDGPYQIIREAVPISGSLAPTTLTPSGELIAASVELIT